MSEVTVGDLINVIGKDGTFSISAGGVRGLKRVIGRRTVQRAGVALTGYTEHLVPDRLQLLGRSELGYIATIPEDARHSLLMALVDSGIPGFVLTAGREAPAELSQIADDRGCAIISTELDTVVATERINHTLAHWLSPRETRHAVLLDVHGVGVMLIGKSGIGKSEVGLELVSRGHRLVADDLVILEQTSERSVVGHSPELARHHMEIRGLGIINIKDLHGVSAVRERKRVELVVELVEWTAGAQFERLGLSTKMIELAGVQVEHLTIPVRPGRSLSLIIEVATRNRLLQQQGTHSAQNFARRLEHHIALDEDPLFDLTIDDGDGENE